MRLLPSSEISRLPSGSCRMPTGRPHTSRRSGPSIQPVRTSRMAPEGFPSLKGMKAMDWPTRLERFHDPWKARKAPPWYSLGNCLPDRKSTRLNSSHANISYAVFCLKKKKANKDYKQNTQRTSLEHICDT